MLDLFCETEDMDDNLSQSDGSSNDHATDISVACKTLIYLFGSFLVTISIVLIINFKSHINTFIPYMTHIQTGAERDDNIQPSIIKIVVLVSPSNGYKKTALVSQSGSLKSGYQAGVAFSCISRDNSLSLPAACGRYEIYHL